jgi:hypothetical protein
MFCHECGTKISDGFKFCPQCGANAAAKPILQDASAASVQMRNRSALSPKIVIGFLVLLLVALIAAIANQDTDKNAEKTAPLDYSKPVYTTDHAIICPTSLLSDRRADHDIATVMDMYMSTFTAESKAAELGCEVWKGGIEVTAKPMDGMSHLVAVNTFAFTVAAHLTNNSTAAMPLANTKPAQSSTAQSQQYSPPSQEVHETYSDGQPSDKPANWTAMSHTAQAITGDVETSRNNILLLNKPYPLTLVRDLRGNELQESAKLLSIEAVASPSLEGRLFRTSIPATAPLINGNTICGRENAEWVLVLTTHAEASGSNTGDWLYMAFFSGDAEPVLQTQALGNSKALCGTYNYQMKSTVSR